jgi:hypothetical protein
MDRVSFSGKSQAVKGERMSDTREHGWLQQVVSEASKRVDSWPEWKKNIEIEKDKGNDIDVRAVGEPSANVEPKVSD